MRGRHRQVMRLHASTELFFLAEATAFAAGHRPCAECRYADYRRFKAAWSRGVGLASGADGIVAVGTLPDGVFMQLERSAWLLWKGQVLEWSAGGIVRDGRRPRRRVRSKS